MKLNIMWLVRGGLCKQELPDDKAIWILERNGKVIYKTNVVDRNWRGIVEVTDCNGRVYTEVEEIFG